MFTFNTSHLGINDNCSLLQHYSLVSLTVASFQYLAACDRLPLCTFSTSQRGIVDRFSLSAPRGLESWTVVHGYHKCLQRVLLWLLRFEMTIAMAGTLIGWSGPSAFCLGPNINSRHPNRLVRAHGILRDGPSELVAHISFFVHGQVRRHGSSDATAARTQRKSYATHARRNASQAQRQLGHNASQTQRRSDAAQFQNCLLSTNDFDPNPYQSVFWGLPDAILMHPESQDCLLVMLQRVSSLWSMLS